MNRSVLWGLLLAIGLGLAGCGGDSAPPGGDQLGDGSDAPMDLSRLVIPDGARFFLLPANIQGESTYRRYENWIEISSFSWGSTQTGKPGGGGGMGAGKVVFNELVVAKGIDRASPKLAEANWKGTHLKDAVLAVVQGHEPAVEVYRIKLSDVLISSYQVGLSSSSDQLGTESLSLNFTKIELTYRRQKPDGSLEAPITVSWNLKTNASKAR